MKALKQKVTAKNTRGKEVSRVGSFREVVYMATLWTQKKYTDIQFYTYDGKQWIQEKN